MTNRALSYESKADVARSAGAEKIIRRMVAIAIVYAMSHFLAEVVAFGLAICCAVLVMRWKRNQRRSHVEQKRGRS